MNTTRYHRQLDILNPSNFEDVNIHIIGAGSVGSFTAVTLTKMGMINVEIWDDDSVESHNISNQFYMQKNVGELKCVALEKLISEFSNCKIEIHTKKFTEDDELDLSSGKNIVITTTDSLESRKIVFDKIKYQPNCIFLDARMGLEVGRIFTIRLTNKEDLDFYERTLVNKSVEAPCTARTIIYNVLIIAGMISNQVKKVVKDEQFSKEINFDLKNLIFTYNGGET